MSHLPVLIADDHPVFRRGLRQVIEAEDGLVVVAEAEDSIAALALLRQWRPAVVVLDLDMPSMDGFEVIRAIRQEQLPAAIVILTMRKDEQLFHQAMTLNVQGFLLKDSAAKEIAAAIRAAAAGDFFISPSVSSYLVNRGRRPIRLVNSRLEEARLTPTERRLLVLVAAYKTSKEIAAQLRVSHRTVENHRANICQKLNLRGTHALLRFALEHNVEHD
ncbi:MAG: response regulator transcription factor [Paludibaculum sp.]